MEITIAINALSGFGKDVQKIPQKVTNKQKVELYKRCHH